ncbi:Uncharacterized protein SCF082_LOCUS9057 [Durusdinium trenchii]|uniref:Uncharacterized protein n=1 Tax=Durusdinium trenchii TaxID=1381693 RepID=A0ABP0IWN0_9DINO
MYRVPAMVRGFCRENHSMLTHRVRLVLTCQARLLMWDLWMLFTTLLASLLAILTLVRALEFLQVAFLYCKSLQDLRAAAWRAVKDALSSLWELISLLTLWETYTSLVRASICAVLIPAWGLTPLPHWLRIILWLGLCSLPWLLTLQRAVIIFGALEVVLFTINLLRKGCQTCQAPSAYLNAMRMTGINGLVLVFVVGEGVMLASVEYLEPLFMNWTWFIVAACIGVLWLIVMSLPHAMSSSIKSCVDAVKFHMAIQLLRRCCLLPAAVVFLSQMDPQAQDATSRAAGMLLAFLSFTAVLGWDLLCQEHLPENLGLDLVQPPAFLAGLFFAQVAFVHQQLHGNLTTCFAASLLMPVWILSFQLVSGSIGGPLWLMPLQLAASCLVSYLAWARLVHFNHQWAGAACLALLAALGFLAAWWLARRWRRQASSGAAQVLKQLLDRLAQKGAQLEAATLVETKGEDLSPEEGAMQLEVLEKGTRMEYLSKSFLSTRHDWLSSLRAGRRHFDVVVTCGTALLEAICTPPSTLQIFSLMRRKSGRRVPTAIWQIILEFVSDVKYMSKMLNPVVQNFNSGGPDRQLMRAWELMNGVGVRVRSFELTRGQAPLFVPQNFRSLQGFPVTVLDERGPWRGRITKVWRDCVEVKSALSGWQNVFVFSDGRVQVLSQSPEDRLAEDLHFWTLLVHRDLRDVCPCGRPRKGEHSNCCRKCYRRYRPNWVSNGYGDLGHTAGCEERTAGLEPYQAYNLEDERSGGPF